MMSFKEFKTACAAKVAGPQEDLNAKNSAVLPSTTSTPSPSPSTLSATQEELHIKMCKMFTFIDDTYRDLRRFNSGLHKDSVNMQLMQTINKYKSGCNEIYTKALESYDMCYKLAQNIVHTIDIFKELCTCLSDLEEYNYRLCEILSIFIVCELRLSIDAPQQEQLLIAHRIIYIMRKHLVQEEQNETLYNILRTLVYIPKFFNARDIMCTIFGEFIPMKPVLKVNVLPDKLYMLYIIVFYRWMMMQKDDDNKQLLVNFAESFMKPSVSLCSNTLYAAYLPMYTTHSTATRTILNNLKFYRDIRNASIIDNAFKKIETVVNLCDDEEDDIIIVDNAPTTDFAQIFASVSLEPLSGSMSNIKLEEKTVVSTIDLTEEEEEGEPTNSITSTFERHNKWLNEFQRSAKQYLEAQLLLEKQQDKQLISNGEHRTVICLDSDSEQEEEEEEGISTSASKETRAAAANATATQQNTSEDLFVDSYPLTNTPITCDWDVESLESEDENDVTKISARFLSGNLRTYQAKKNYLSEAEDKNNSNANENNKTQDMNKAYRRDSIHISSSPPEGSQIEDDEGTDVQDEHDDLIDEVDEEVNNAYNFLPTTVKRTEKKLFPKEIRPMGPYPTYNNMQNDKVVYSQALTRNPKQQQYQDKQYYYSDSSEKKTPKKQKKRVQFNTSPLGPTSSSAPQKAPLKPALQQPKYKVSDNLEYFHLRGFERFSCAPSIAGSTSTLASNSTSSSIKQQEHLAAAATLFRNVFDSVRQTQTYPGPFSPTSSSLSSRSLPSPITPSTSRKKSRLPKNKKQAIKLRRSTVGTREDFLNSYDSINNNDDCYSIIRSREILNEGYNSTGGIGMTSYRKRSDDYGVSSDSDLIVNGRFKNDAKLRKRCAVVITPTKEIIQYERKRNEMYNEILQKQRRKLELRTIEKQREKERRRLDRREEKREQTKSNNREAAATAPDKVATYSKKIRNYKEIFMSSESEYETNFQLRTRKHRQEKFQELEPLNIQIEMTEATTTSLLSQIDAHLDKPTTERTYQYEVKEKKEQTPSCNKDNNQQICDISCDKNSPTKMRELNLLADIAQHLSPYQLDLPENNNPPRTPSPAYEPTPMLIPPAAPTTQETKEGPKEKVTVTEHVIIQSLDNLLEKTNSQFNNNDQQQQTFKTYAHEPQLNMAATSKTSPCENVSQNENQHNNTQIENQDNSLSNNCTDKELNCNIQTDKALEQILEESMSVLKSVTSPFNALNECTAIRSKTCSDSTIPLLISSVESLNHIEQNETNAKPKSDDKLHLLLKDATKNNFENVVSSEGHELHNNKETIETNKNVVVEQRRNETTAADLPSSILEQGETSIMCSTDLAHIPNNETEISQTLNTPSLLAADLSDISLESEISKNLPEIAEPSPVVTDMSDNSSESEVSKSFGLPTSITNTDTANASSVADMSLPDLSLVMTNIAQSSTLSTNHQQEPLESSFNQFNCTLNTPTKLAVATSKAEEPTNNSINDLNTPLKFAIQPELESNSMPPKITLEPEADNNVTKFLDLILNKTVTDAESETRDKIIKELNALTADTTATASSETSESINNNEVLLPEPNTAENAITDSKSIEENKTMETKETEEVSNVFEEQTNSTKHKCKTQQTLEYSSKSHIENKSSAAETVEFKTTVKELSVSQMPSENNELNLNPPIASSVEETRSESLSDIATTELSDIEPSTSLSAFNKFKLPAVKQTFNIKCRVRLKRLNIDEHCKTPQKETWMAIPISKPEEPVSSNNHISKCDIAPETTTKIKKACLKQNNKQSSEEFEEKTSESFAQDTAAADEVIPCKKPMLEGEQTTTQPTETTATVTAQQSPTPTSTPTQTQTLTQASSQATTALIFNTTSTSPPNSKSKSKPLKTVTFDLSNLNEELRESTASNHRQKSKSHHAASIAAGALGCYLKNSRPPRKLPDNTLRAAETLQIFVNTINDSTRTPPPAEFNKKRSPIKNKCIAEDETPRPPPASTLMDTPPCKKICTEKSRSQITSSKCKDQLVSSLSTASISNISDISTARIYTSSPLDQTLPEYDDNVDTVADSELILPPTAGSLRRKLKKPKKSMTRPEPVDDISTDDISNQPECNGEDDTDAVVDNEDDVFAEELLPIPAANEHILEEIVSGRPSHIGTGTVIRDDYMNIEATATVPVYLFNDESSDLVTPDPVQSSNTTNVVDSSSYLNTSPSAATNNVVAVIPASTTSAMVNLEKSMLSPSEHEVSSTQETFYQTPTKSKQPEACAEKSSTSKDKGNSSSAFLANSISKQKPDDNKFQNNEQYQTSSTTGLLQNNQVDTTNHSPEMCTLSLTATTTTTTTLTSNRKIRKASTHDEILLNELQQQQLPSNKRKSTATTFCCESTSDNNSNTTAAKTKVVSKNLEDVKSNGALIKVEDKFKKLLKEVCKRDKNQIPNDLDVGGLTVASNNSVGGGGGGSSPSTTTTILEEKIPRTKRKKQKSSKSKKNKSHSERSSKIVLKASKLTPHIPIPANPLIITIPKSRLLRPPATPTPPTAVEAQDEQQQNEFLDIPNAKLFIEKNKETTITTAAKNSNHHVNPHNHAVQPNAEERQKIINATVAMAIEPKRPDSPTHTQTEIVNVKTNTIFESEMEEIIHKANSTIMPKKKSHSSTSATKKKEKLKTNHNANNSSTTCSNTNNNNNNNIIFVRDKYDLIKSKDKHHQQHHHDQHEQQQDVVKEKSKSKTSSQSKAATPNNTRLHKSSTKEKIKGEKHKGKHKGSEKSANQPLLQPDIVLKLNTLQGSSSSSSTATTTLSSSNAKQSSSKAKRSNSSSSSSSSSATSAILKSKTNLSATQSSAATAVLTAAPLHNTTATLSTNNVRKKLKIK